MNLRRSFGQVQPDAGLFVNQKLLSWSEVSNLLRPPERHGQDLSSPEHEHRVRNSYRGHRRIVRTWCGLQRGTSDRLTAMPAVSLRFQ